jgi:Bacterial regulatory proteins, gntR family
MTTLHSPQSSPPAMAAALGDAVEREEQIRDAYLRYCRATASVDRVPASRVLVGCHAVWDAVAPWQDLARYRLEMAAGSHADSARWLRLITAVQEPPDRNITEPTYEHFVTLHGSGRAFFLALLEAEKPGPTVGDLRDRVHRAVKNGDYRPGQCLVRRRIAEEYRVCEERVKLALEDLGHNGVVVLSPSGRARIPAPFESADRAQEIAGWLGALISWGVYPAGTLLPARKRLARSLASETADVTRALRRLQGQDMLLWRPRTRPRVAPAGPPASPVSVSLNAAITKLPRPSAAPVNLDTARETAMVARTWWSHRSFPPSDSMNVVFQMLQAMASHFLSTGAYMIPQTAETYSTLRRAAVTATAPWPTSPHGQAWRTACLGVAVLDVLSLLDGADAVAADRSPQSAGH